MHFIGTLISIKCIKSESEYEINSKSLSTKKEEALTGGLAMYVLFSHLFIFEF